jgi:hypothetical protein
MKRSLTLVFLFFLTNWAISQIALNPGIDTSSIEHKEILTLWKNYVNTYPSKDNNEYLKFWNKEEKQLWENPDLTLHGIGDQSIFSMGSKTVLSILPHENDYYQIKTAFGWNDSTHHFYLLCITNHYAKKVNDKYKLFSALKANSSNLSISKTPEYSTYTIKGKSIPKHTLDSLSEFNQKLRKDYKIEEVKKLNIIYGEKSQELYHVLGFDFNLMSSTNNPSSGMSNVSNKMIFLSGLASLFHETTHIYINPLFPESPLLEGVATFYGGSMGKSLNDGIIFLNNYVNQNPQINLYEKFKARNFYINNELNPIYVLQGLLIKLAFNKEGTQGIINLLSIKTDEEIFENFFKLKNEKEINRFLKGELKNNSY